MVRFGGVAGKKFAGKRPKCGQIRARLLCAGLLCAFACMLACARPCAAATSDYVQIYRLYNPNSREHLWTSDTNEIKVLVSQGLFYKEGKAWVAPTKSKTPVHRLYNRVSGEHLYTRDTNEVKVLTAPGHDWKDEGVKWYSDDARGVPVYRVYNKHLRIGAHHFTTDKNEYDTLPKVNSWKQEGVAWYGVKGVSVDDGSNDIAAPSNAGRLRVEGTQLVSSKTGKPVQLRGVSTHGLAWYPQYVNQQLFTELRKSWNANLVRLALYTAEYDGYCTGGNQANLMQLVLNGVEYSSKADMYAIVDWHVLNEGNPLTYKEQAKSFFKTVSKKLAGKNNVIYEICNEPCNGASWQDVKSYASEVIPIIRANDPNAVVIVGTPNWSQEVNQAAADPLGYMNVMYALHFYAGTHKEELRTKLKNAYAAGLPVFVSEFGACNADGNGGIDRASANTWISLLNQLNVSYACWNLSNKNEGAALISASCGKSSGFTKDDLSSEGKWLWDILHSYGGTSSSGSGSDNGNAGGTDPGSNDGSGSDTNDDAGSGPIIGSSEDGAVSWQLSRTNSWSDGAGTVVQYSLSVTNNSGKALSGWKVLIPFNQSVALVGSWCGTFSANGSVLSVSNVDWNGALQPGGTATGIGFQLRGNSSLAPLNS